MNKNSTILLTLFLLFTIGMFSCARKEEPETLYTKVQGKWQLVKTATDDNNNNVIDDSEIYSVPAVQDYQIVFNKDFTGAENSIYNGVGSLPLNFTWALNDNSISCAYVLHDTLTYNLVTITSTNLTLKLSTDYGITWFSYIKR